MRVTPTAKADKVRAAPAPRFVLLLQVSTGQQFTVEGFVGDSEDCPGVPADRVRKSPAFKNWADCLSVKTLRRVELLTKGMMPQCFAPDMRALLSPQLIAAQGATNPRRLLQFKYLILLQPCVAIQYPADSSPCRWRGQLSFPPSQTERTSQNWRRDRKVSRAIYTQSDPPYPPPPPSPTPLIMQTLQVLRRVRDL